MLHAVDSPCSLCSLSLLQSESCGLSIPEIELVLQAGTLGGRFTTLEGILDQVYEELSEKRLSELPMMLPSSRRPSLGPELKLSAHDSNVPSAARKQPPPPLQWPSRPLPLPLRV